MLSKVKREYLIDLATDNNIRINGTYSDKSIIKLINREMEKIGILSTDRVVEWIFEGNKLYDILKKSELCTLIQEKKRNNEMLGKGTRGSVYVNDEKYIRYNVKTVAKMIPIKIPVSNNQLNIDLTHGPVLIDNTYISNNAYNEILISALMSRYYGKCLHFPVLGGYFNCNDRSTYSIIEYISGSLSQLFRKLGPFSSITLDLTCDLIKSLLFQIIITIITYQQDHLVHFDLHENNILFLLLNNHYYYQDINISNFPFFHYHLSSLDFYLPNFGIIFKLADFDFGARFPSPSSSKIPIKSTKSSTKSSSTKFSSIKSSSIKSNISDNHNNFNPTVLLKSNFRGSYFEYNIYPVYEIGYDIAMCVNMFLINLKYLRLNMSASEYKLTQYFIYSIMFDMLNIFDFYQSSNLISDFDSCSLQHFIPTSPLPLSTIIPSPINSPTLNQLKNYTSRFSSLFSEHRPIYPLWNVPFHHLIMSNSFSSFRAFKSPSVLASSLSF